MKIIVTGAQMSAIDNTTITERNIPGLLLMENAGRSVADEIEKRVSPLTGKKVNIFCGTGNNGGDGFVIARHLMNRGADVSVFLAAPKNAITGDAQVNLDVFLAMEGRVKEILEEGRIKNQRHALTHGAIVIDALLGTGMTSAPRGVYTPLIETINSSRALKVAVDMPSGVSADDGAIPGAAVHADVTITFATPKVGHFTEPGRSACGALVVTDISIPTDIISRSERTALLPEEADIKRLLPARPANAHKGTFGHLLVVGGSVGMGGSVALASEAALRMGAGLVSAALPKSLQPPFELGLREVMTLPLPETKEGAISHEGAAAIRVAITNKSALLIGPGLGSDPATIAFAREVIEMSESPMVIDADGLNAIGRDTDLVKKRKGSTIITPHPGEMSRLTGRVVTEIQADRIGTAKSYAGATGAVVVLKGSSTVIASPEGDVWLNPTGNNGLATAGAGDVLAGMIAGLLAQGADAAEAALAGVYLHGKVADAFVQDGRSPRSLVAGDLIALLPRELARY